MGSILADILHRMIVLVGWVEQKRKPIMICQSALMGFASLYPILLSINACRRLPRSAPRRRSDDRMDIGIRHRGRQCHQPVARGQHATIDKCTIENRLTPRSSSVK